MNKAFVFPGQGSQSVGMGKDLAAASPVARRVFEEIDEALSQNLSSIMFDGPIEELTLTANAQPALFAVSMAIMHALEKEGGLDVTKFIKFVAGHSLGEYSALAAAKSFGIATAARILKARGVAMQEAVPIGVGNMLAILGAELGLAEEIALEAAKGEVCSIANDNAIGQVVLSGTKSAITRAVEIAKAKGVKRSILLPVSAPFHCTMMTPAADVMARELAAIVIEKPIIPIIPNVSAEARTDPDEIRELLVDQVTARVRWRESVLFMRDNGVEELIEIGSGKVLTGLTRRVDQNLKSSSIQDPYEIDEFLKSL